MDITGTWNATLVQYTSTADPSKSVDLIADGGTLSIVITAGMNYTLTVSFPGEPVEAEQGTVSLADDVVTIDPAGPDVQFDFDFALSGDTMTLTSDDEEFDFDGDDIDEPAMLLVVLPRQ